MCTIKATLQASQLRCESVFSDKWTTWGITMPGPSAVARQGSCAISQGNWSVWWNIPTLVIHRRCRGMKDLWYGKTHVELRQSQLIHNIWQLNSPIWRKFISQRHLKKTQPTGFCQHEWVPTLILLSFIWIFLETTLAQYFSPRKSQNILPRKAFTQASGSTDSPELLRIWRTEWSVPLKSNSKTVGLQLEANQISF